MRLRASLVILASSPLTSPPAIPICAHALSQDRGVRTKPAEPDSAPISGHPGGDVGRTDRRIRTIVSITQTKSAPLIHHFHLSCMINFPSSFSVSQTIREAMRKILKIVAIRSTTFPAPSPDGHVVSAHGTLVVELGHPIE
jgi:hypothetical protein